MATDAELNQYMSVKKYAPYRKDNRWDKTRGDRLKELKQSVAERSHGAFGMDAGPSRSMNGEKPKRRMGRKERLKLKAEQTGTVEEKIATPGSPDRSQLKRKHDEIGGMNEGQEDSHSSKRKRRRRKKVQE